MLRLLKHTKLRSTVYPPGALIRPGTRVASTVNPPLRYVCKAALLALPSTIGVSPCSAHTLHPYPVWIFTPSCFMLPSPTYTFLTYLHNGALFRAMLHPLRLIVSCFIALRAGSHPAGVRVEWCVCEFRSIPPHLSPVSYSLCTCASSHSRSDVGA